MIPFWCCCDCCPRPVLPVLSVYVYQQQSEDNGDCVLTMNFWYEVNTGITNLYHYKSDVVSVDYLSDHCGTFIPLSQMEEAEKALWIAKSSLAINAVDHCKRFLRGLVEDSSRFFDESKIYHNGPTAVVDFYQNYNFSVSYRL